MSSVYAKRFEAVFLCTHPKGPLMSYTAAAKYIKKSKSFVKPIKQSTICLKEANREQQRARRMKRSYSCSSVSPLYGYERPRLFYEQVFLNIKQILSDIGYMVLNQVLPDWRSYSKVMRQHIFFKRFYNYFEYSEIVYSCSIWRMDSNTIFESTVRNLKRNTTSAWVTERVCPSRIDVNMYLNCLIFPHVKSVKKKLFIGKTEISDLTIESRITSNRETFHLSNAKTWRIWMYS